MRLVECDLRTIYAIYLVMNISHLVKESVFVETGVLASLGQAYVLEDAQSRLLGGRLHTAGLRRPFQRL